MIKKIQTIERETFVTRFEMEKTTNGWVGIITTSDGEIRTQTYISAQDWNDFWNEFNHGSFLDEYANEKLNIDGEVTQDTESEYLN